MFKHIWISALLASLLTTAAPASVFATHPVPIPIPLPDPGKKDQQQEEQGKIRKSLDIACIQAAVDKRDTAIIAAFDAFHASVKTALETRRSALKAAWGISDRKERRAAIQAAWEASRKSRREASKAYRKANRAAWEQFRTDRKACGTSATSDDTASEGSDLSL